MNGDYCRHHYGHTPLSREELIFLFEVKLNQLVEV